jgi:hypothetical protein
MRVLRVSGAKAGKSVTVAKAGCEGIEGFDDFFTWNKNFVR